MVLKCNDTTCLFNKYGFCTSQVVEVEFTHMGNMLGDKVLVSCDYESNNINKIIEEYPMNIDKIVEAIK